jgi:hypothetical protein
MADGFRRIYQDEPIIVAEATDRRMPTTRRSDDRTKRSVSRQRAKDHEPPHPVAKRQPIVAPLLSATIDGLQSGMRHD